MKYPNKLREIRKRNNVSANDLADLLEVTFQHYYALERGERQLSAMQLTKLSNRLNTTTDEIINGNHKLENTDTAEQKNTPEPNSPEDKDIFSAVARAKDLPRHDKKLVAEMLDTLIDNLVDKNKKG